MNISVLPFGNFENVFSEREIEGALNNALTQTAKAIQVDYRVTTKTWDHQPVFEIKTPAKFERLIFTTDKIYLFVSGGTRPHVIKPKNASMLRFQAGYSAKTSVRVIGSTAGGSSGRVIYSRGVMHPGTKARQFPEVIGKKWEREWPRQLDRAMMVIAK